MFITKFDWSPNDPRGASPKPGEPGHFRNHEWLIEFAKHAYNEMISQNKKIAELESRILKLEQAPKSAPVKEKP